MQCVIGAVLRRATSLRSALPVAAMTSRAAASSYTADAIKTRLSKQQKIVKALLPSVAEFQLEDAPGTSTVKMVRLLDDDSLVEVSFDGHEEGYANVGGVHFRGVRDCVQMMVSVHKGPESVQFACVGTPALQVLSVRHRDEEDAKPDDVFGPVEMDRFSEEAQDGILAYLRSLHVDDKLSTFVCAYALFKQNSEKLRFMDQLKEFVR